MPDQWSYWALPGSWADVGESLIRATEREIEEEAGYTAQAAKLLALYDLFSISLNQFIDYLN